MKKFSVKKLLTYVGILAFSGTAVLGITGCGEDKSDDYNPDLPITPGTSNTTNSETTTNITKLEKPVISFNNETNELTWNEVQNAEGYRITFDGATNETTDTSITLDVDEEETFSATVQALGDGVNYEDSDVATYNGYKESQDVLCYEQIVENVENLFSNVKFGSAIHELGKIVTVDFNDGIFTIFCTTRRTNVVNPSTTYQYRQIKIDLNDYMESSDNSMKTMEEASEFIEEAVKENGSQFSTIINDVEASETENQIYNKLLEDENLTGNLKEYLDQGYTAEKIYSYNNRNYNGSISVSCSIKLTKDYESKVIISKYLISSENDNFAYATYLDGSVSDVEISETSYEEFSQASSNFENAEAKANKKSTGTSL